RPASVHLPKSVTRATKRWRAAAESALGCRGESQVARGALGEIGARVDSSAVNDRHEVEVWAGGPTGHPNVGDDLAGSDHLADANDGHLHAVIEMAVERREVVAVRDDHDRRGVAVREVRLADGDDLTRGRRTDRRVHRCGDVEAVVEAAPPRTEACGDRPSEGPERKLRPGEGAESRARSLFRGELRVERFRLLEPLVEDRALVVRLVRRDE